MRALANDGTVKIGADVDESGFKKSLSGLSKAAKSASIPIGVEVDKKKLDSELSGVGKDVKPIEVSVKPDTDDFEKELDTLEKKTRENVSTLNDLDKALELNPTSTDLLIEKQKLLQSAVSTAAEKADLLNSALEKAKGAAAAEKNAEAYRKLVISVSSAEAEAKQMKSELDSVSKKLKQGEDATSDLDDATDDLGHSYTSVGDIIKGVAIGELIASGVKTAVGAINDLLGELWNLDEATEEYRIAQGKLNTAFISAGMNTENAKQAYSDFYKILGDVDTATEASQLLATLSDGEADLAKWTNIAAGVYGTFGDSLPVEGLIEAANETAKTGKVTGVLADALNWAGISEEKFNKELELLASEGQRNYRIMQTLSKTYDDAADAFYRNNEAVIEARENQIQLDDAMSEVGETISRIKNVFLSELSPTISDVAGRFSELANSVNWEEIAARIGDFVGKIDFEKVFDGIQNAFNNVDLESLFDTIGNVVSSLISFTLAVSPVVSTVAQFAEQLFQFFGQMNPQIKLFLVGMLGAVAAVAKIGGAIGEVGGAVSGVGKIVSTFAGGPGDRFYATFVKWSLIIISVVTSLSILIALINTLMGKGDSVNATLNSMGNAMNSGTIRPRSAPAAPAAHSDDSGEGNSSEASAYGLTRARAIASLESAIPAAQSRAEIATAAMTPTAGYSTPVPDNRGGSGGGNAQQTPIIVRPQITIRYDGDLAQLGQVLKPVIDAEDTRVGQGVE